MSNELIARLNSAGAETAWGRVVGRGPTVLWLGGFLGQFERASVAVVATAYSIACRAESAAAPRLGCLRAKATLALSRPTGSPQS